MLRPESEEEDGTQDAALPPPGFTMLTKHIRIDGACHGKPDAEGTDVESDSDVEKKFDESTGNLARKMFSTFG